jgi:cation transport protein ChaC
MWNPGFPYADASPARLYGYHRRLCLWSIHYRGTKEHPGLVLGLDRGGSCNGMAFRVDAAHIDEAVAYLKEREMLHNAYHPRVKRIYPRKGKPVEALTFVSRPDHPQFANHMNIDKTVSIILSARGERGENCEYVINTVEHLEEFGIYQSELHEVAERLR